MWQEDLLEMAFDDGTEAVVILINKKLPEFL